MAEPWQCVLDTPSLHGSIRLCVCLYGDGDIELLKMKFTKAESIQEQYLLRGTYTHNSIPIFHNLILGLNYVRIPRSRYEKALAVLHPALGVADLTVLSTQARRLKTDGFSIEN